LQDWTVTDDFAGVDMAGLDNGSLDIVGLDIDGRMCVYLTELLSHAQA